MPTLPTLKDYSDLTIEQTAANFPFLKHLYLCNETSGSQLADSIAGCHINRSSGDIPTFGVNANGAKYCVPTMGSNIGTFSAVPADVTGPCIFFAVGEYASTGGVIFGNNADVRVQIGANGIFYDGTTTITSVAGLNTLGEVGRAAIITAYNDATGGKCYAVSSDGTTTDDDAAFATTTLASIPYTSVASAVNVTISDTSVLKLYYLAVMEFTTAIPTDYKAGLSWMTAQVLKGNKSVYPGWLGKS